MRIRRSLAAAPALVALLAGCTKPAANATAAANIASAAPAVSSATAGPVSIPFVGCASDGQQGPQPGPTGAPVAMTLAPAVAARLAYYKGADTEGVLAPRGWKCGETEGSSGAALLVAPAVGPNEILSGAWAGGQGPAVQLSVFYGGTSGRFQAAQVISRVFPSHEAFARGVINEGIEPASDFPSGPFAADRMTARGDAIAEFETPAQRQGLGTTFGMLKPGAAPIDGVAILVGADPDVDVLSVRVPAADHDLASVIVARLEGEAGPSASKVAIEPTEPTPAAAKPTSGGGGPDLGVVRQFYAALAKPTARRHRAWWFRRSAARVRSRRRR